MLLLLAQGGSPADSSLQFQCPQPHWLAAALQLGLMVLLKVASACQPLLYDDAARRVALRLDRLFLSDLCLPAAGLY